MQRGNGVGTEAFGGDGMKKFSVTVTEFEVSDSAPFPPILLPVIEQF